MLTYSQVESAIPVAQELAEKNLILTPIAGPLASLVAEFSVAGAVASSVNTNSEADVYNFTNQLTHILVDQSTSISQTDVGSLLAQSNHDLKMDEFSELAKTGVLAVTTRARGVCIPAIVRLENSIGVALQNYEDRSIANVGIDEVGIDDILDSEDVFEYFSQYSEFRVIPIRGVGVFPELTGQDLAKLIEAGSPEVNEHLTNAMTLSASVGELGSWVYSMLYLGTRLTEDTVHIAELRNLAKTLFGNQAGIEALMLAYYFGKGLLLNLPDGVNASLKEIESRVGNLTKILGVVIYGEIKTYRETVKNKVLFPVGLPFVDKGGRVNTKLNVRVNKEVYREFLANGGTPEIIYGTMVSDHCVDPTMLIDGKEKYERKYQEFVNINRAYTTSGRLSLYRDAIRDEFYKMVADTEELKGFDATSGMYVRMVNQLERMGASHIATPLATYTFLRSLVCQSFYPDSPQVEKVISDIDNHSCIAGEENLSPAEVGTFVLTDLIVDWFCDQVLVSKTK